MEATIGFTPEFFDNLTIFKNRRKAAKPLPKAIPQTA
jgi:hypothetical protein